MQAYGREEGAVAEFRSGSERSLALSLKLYSTETVFALVVDSVLAVGTAGLVWLGALHVMDGRLNIGELTIFLSYLKDLYAPIQSISQNLAEISSSRAGLERVFKVLDIEPDVQDAPHARPLPAVAGRVRFENVHFAYDDGRPVLARRQPRDPAGRARRAPGAHRGRQEHARQPARPLLRPAGGARHDRRARPARRDASSRSASRSR